MTGTPLIAARDLRVDVDGAVALEATSFETRGGSVAIVGDGYGLLITRCVTSTAQHFGGALIGTVGDDGFETLAGQLTQRTVGIRAQFNLDIKIAQHSPQDPNDLFVRAQ